MFVARHLQPHANLNIAQLSIQFHLFGILTKPPKNRCIKTDGHKTMTMLSTYCGNDMALGPPYPAPLPYINDVGLTVEVIACSGINAQCCSGLNEETHSRYVQLETLLRDIQNEKNAPTNHSINEIPIRNRRRRLVHQPKVLQCLLRTIKIPTPSRNGLEIILLNKKRHKRVILEIIFHLIAQRLSGCRRIKVWSQHLGRNIERRQNRMFLVRFRTA